MAGLTELLLGGSKTDEQSSDSNTTSLTDQLLAPKSEVDNDKYGNTTRAQNTLNAASTIGNSLAKGFNNVINSGASGIGLIDEKVSNLLGSDSGEKRNEAFK